MEPKIEEDQSLGSSKEEDVVNGSSSASEADETGTPSLKVEPEEGVTCSKASDSLEGSETETTTSDVTAVQSTTLPPSSSRLMRNLAEKMRRDKLNTYISELSSLVPIVAMATKRMDKTSVLRLSANFLRIHLNLKQNRKPSKKLAPEGLEANLSTALLESLEGFMLIVTSSGKIVYVSDSVEKLLGHAQMDLMGQSLYTITHNGDHDYLRHHLQPPAEKEDNADDDQDVPDFIPRSPSFFGGNPEDTLSGLTSGQRRSIYVRLAERSMARGDPTRHVTVHLIGMLRPPQNKKDKKDAGTKNKKDCSSTTGGNDEYMLVCVARPIRNKGITELSLMEAIQDEYVTRHLPDGRIIYSDHRIAFVAGYLTEEVMGLSAFHFIHQEDLPWATVANRQMFSSVEGQGYSVYRLKSKTGTLIHLKTKGYLEFNKTTQKVETFVCVNTLLSEEEGDKELEKERDRITPFITFQQVTTIASSTSTNGSLSSIPALPAPAITSTVTSQQVVPRNNTLPSNESASSTDLNGLSDLTVENPATATAMQPTVDIIEYENGEHEVVDSFESCNNILANGGDLLLATTGTVDAPLASPAEITTILMSDSDVAADLDVKHIPESVGLRSTGYMTMSGITRTQDVTNSSNGHDHPRLKRPLSEVDDIMLTSSAKRAMGSTFITSYSAIRHMSPHVTAKWAAEKTIIYDQHNNNG